MMVEWFREYWPYAVGLVGVCVVAFFIFRAAAKAYSAHQKSLRAEEKYITRLISLKEKYVPLTEEAISNAPQEELLEGTALGIQLFLQKQEQDEKAFEQLSDEKKYIYTLDVFVTDKTLEKFFRENSAILKSRLVPALELISLKSFGERIFVVSKMFDDRDETVSLDEKKLKALDEELEKEDFLSLIKLSAAKYIKENSSLFV